MKDYFERNLWAIFNMKTAILSFKIDGTCLFTSLEFVEMDIYTLLEHFLILETGNFLRFVPKRSK